MATGKVLQFDQVRGYGFVAADDGGEDVFLHASAFDGDPSKLLPGTDLEFLIMASDRGRKAYAVHIAGHKAAPPAGSTQAATEDDLMCDVLSRAEFVAEVTELLLNIAPGLTGAQILEVRQGMLEYAGKRGWVDA